MRVSRHQGIVTPVSLREVYHERGQFNAKLMIDPAHSQSVDSVEVSVRNADGCSMDFSFKRWGTKLNVTFLIDEATPDGVSVIDVTMNRRGQTTRERFDFWVVK